MADTWTNMPPRKRAGCAQCNDGWPRWVNKKTGEAKHSLPEPAGDWTCTASGETALAKALDAPPYDDKCRLTGEPCGRLDCDPQYGECGAQAFAKPTGPYPKDLDAAIALANGKVPPLAFPDRPVMPLQVAAFGPGVAAIWDRRHRHRPHGWGSPRCWALTMAVVLIVLGMMGRGVVY